MSCRTVFEKIATKEKNGFMADEIKNVIEPFGGKELADNFVKIMEKN